MQPEYRKLSNFYLATKRSIDIIGALIGLIITSPIFLIICILYLFGDNKGPIFFCQKRIGKNRKEFKIYKFRSMIVNAEEVLKSDIDLYNKYLQNNYKLEPDEDPRITRIGRFLRETSLDELPQLINVLKGDMSLVGPRPVVKEELKEYKFRLNEFLTVRPGVTGYWQICGRSDVGYPERADLEFYYIDHQSFKLDMKILLNTVLLVIVRKGAY
ncbi:sugar transferase [Niallia sp. 03133]|uniref:sugar transferase n=1 Tax=Niallia sp. 03133 TaxID=3458060 RepID=UPI0040450485